MKSITRIDAGISEKLHIAGKPGVLRSIAVFLAHSGDSWFWGIALVILWLLGASFWKRWTIVVLVAISVLAALVMGLKFIIRRRRPAGDWGRIDRNTDPHSFPSGHAARAFMIALLTSAMGPPGLALALWIWAPLVSVARVAMGVHYMSDVVAGCAVGILMGLAALQLRDPFLAWLASWVWFPLW